MKKTAFVAILAATALSALGCSSACKDLSAKKADCSKAGPGQAGCEAAVDAAVNAGNADACKAALDGLNQTLK